MTNADPLRPARHPPTHAGWLRLVNMATVGPACRLGLRLRVRGREHVPRGGPLLVACNHVAFIDPLLVALALAPRRPWFMAKEELFRSRLLAPWMRRSGGFPVRRASPDVWAVRTARDLLAGGECLMVFPEGGVSRNGLMRPGFSGTGYLALQPDVTVIPAVIWNTQLLRGPVRVRFGPPISMRELRASPRPGRNRRATELIVARLAEMVPLVGGPPQAPPAGPPWIPAPRGRGAIRS